jgi:carboxypeptidase Taq
MNSYDELMTKNKEITLLGSSAGILNWDMQTYMPARGAALRGEQLGMISRTIHRMSTSKSFGELLSQAENSVEPDDAVKVRNLYLVRKGYDDATRLPEDLVASLSQQQAIASNTWNKAKPKSDWKSFEPELQKMFDLSFKRGEALLDVRGVSEVYDVFIDDFEPKMTVNEISKIFDELRGPLIEWTKKLKALTEDIDEEIVKRKVPVGVQKSLVTDAVNSIGYDTLSESAGGRIDDVEHPFTTGYYDDVRITMRYDKTNPTSAVLVGLHEAGHALYEQNLNQEWKFQPIGAASSFGIHESISRFYENIIGRSLSFWTHFLPKMNEKTNGAFDGVDTSKLVKALNIVRPSKIRVEADEVTYSLHIILRFEIERDLFARRIEVSELPEVWNQKYEEYLGVSFDNHGEGVMQDSHWSGGFFGYFPSYALGNIYGGMWLKTMSKDLKTWDSEVSRGEFKSIQDWLIERIMNKSGLYNPSELMRNITGSGLTAKPFLMYLDNKYSELFH